MKYIILFLSITLSISAYNRQAAYNYAKKWWNRYNLADYYNYNPDGGDCANFVSQCLIAGGLNLKSMCGSAAWGVGGTVPNVGQMGECLRKNGWSITSYLPTNFKTGDVILYSVNHAVIAVSDYPSVTYAAHNNNHFGDPVYYSPAPTFYHYTGSTTGGSGNTGGDTGCKKTCTPQRCVYDVAIEVIAGNYGNGEERVQRLNAKGCDYNLVQQEVNRILS